MRKLGMNLVAVVFFAIMTYSWSCPIEDLNGDCAVGIEDLVILAEQWLDPAGCAGHQDNCADFIGNDGVTLEDLAVMAAQWGVDEAIPVVINEIHYNPDLSYELVEFVELYNAGDETIDLSGWYFSKGISYTFPANTSIAAGEYIVVTEDASIRTISPTTSVHAKYGTDTSLIYGPFAGSLSNEGEKIELRTANGIEVDQVDYQLGFPWPMVGDEIPEGSYGNGYSIQLMNPNLDNDLAGSWRSASPTPGAVNAAVYAQNIPPQIRQVNHSPARPTSSDTVIISAKVTDPDGISSVSLEFQTVLPGSYIPLHLPYHIDNPDYNSGWYSYSMYDNGQGGDEYAGDSVYSIQMPSFVQGHRNLVRYRVTARDSGNHEITVPYTDDPQPNFAYFIYDGVPAWSGAVEPGSSDPDRSEVVTYDEETMNSLPVYYILSRAADITACHAWTSEPSDYIYCGTLIYDGVVYDNIHYRTKGEYSLTIEGKKKWKVNFNRGHRFQARDNYGNKYKTKWDKLNLHTGTCPYWQEFGWDSGVDGMVLNEALTMKLFNLSGLAASNTNFFQLRVIDDAEENPASQYAGDFWGLYIAVEQGDTRFLEEHDLPDGNLYKMGGAAFISSQSATQVTDNSDVESFFSSLYSRNYSWWEENVDLPGYYNYHTISIAVNNSDQRPAYNSFLFHSPLNDRWTMLPWDVDLTYEYATHYTNNENFRYVLEHEQAQIDFKNRARELQDLLLNTDQIAQVIDEFAGMVHDPNSPCPFTQANRARWEYDPYVVSRGRDGLFYISSYWASDYDFPSVVQYMKDFLDPTGILGSAYGGGKLSANASDTAIPATPTITYIGAVGYPENDLRFQTSAFSDPQGTGTFAAMKWRIAEVESYSRPSSSTSGGGTVRLIDAESDWLYFEGYSEPSDPVSAYRFVGFDDSSWDTGQGPIGYGESWINTTLNMRGNYTTVYLRKTFNITDPADFDTLTVGVLYDDGYNLWINGHHIASGNVSGSELAYSGTAGSAIEAGDYITTTFNASGCLVSGTNVIAVQALNASIDNSSDLAIDVVLDANLSSDSNNSGSYQFVYTGKPGKYEIDAVWESEELTIFAGDIQFPADGVKPGKTYRVRCKMKDDTGRWSHWSDPIQFVAGEAIDADILSYLRLTELMYNNGDAEFFELKNISSTVTLDLSNVSITSGVQFGFAGSNVTSLAPGAFVLVVRDQAEFESQYGIGHSSIIAGEFSSGSLSNSGETVKIEDTWNGTIIEFEYADARGWPLAADGAGHSLVPLELTIEEQPLGTLDFGGNWRASTYIGGSPGSEDPTPATGIVINEFMAHTDYSNPSYPDYDSNDWIELYNAGETSVNFNGNWYLSDDSDDLKKWVLPSSVLPSGGWISYDEIAGFHSPITSGFGLDKAGEQIFLSYLPGTTADRVVDCIEYKGQENSVSLSRYPDGGDYWFSTTPGTQDAANNNPIDHVVISEIMYHPQADTDTQTYDEYIELYNPTSSSVNMWTSTGPWALDGGVDYEFPASISLAGGDRILIVDFDPAAETARLDAFEAAYGTGDLTANVDIFGPWSGNLSNNGERITLEKPQDSDEPLDPSAISWIIVDECVYNDYWPWPTEPDGTGSALKRLSSLSTASGNDAANWTGQSPTPGW